MKYRIPGLLVLALLCFTTLPAQARPEKPNILFIFADDLGYADLSSFGSTTISTPHLDRLANEGMKFTDFYSASQVCSPSRAALLTGRYPIRSGVNMVYFATSMEGMPQSEITIAELLKPAGYATGLVGKWHLGHLDRFMPWNQGFDEFYGVGYSNDMKNFFLYNNQEIIYDEVDQHYLTRNYTEMALDFIERHSSEPFFLYLAHTMPHVPLYASPEFEGKSKGGLFGDVVQELDWSTGQIVERLEQLGLLENTLIVFSSDNGPWLTMRENGGSAGILRSGKTTSFDGGYKVPTLAYWQGHIAPTVNNNFANMMDWFPTFAELAGVDIPRDRTIDGRSLKNVLLENNQREATPFFFFKMRIPHFTSPEGEVAGVRMGDWKLKLAYEGFYPEFLEPVMMAGRFSHDEFLFNLKDDPGETNNLLSQHPDKAKEMHALIDNFVATTVPGRPTMGTAADNDDSQHFAIIQGTVILLSCALLALIVFVVLIIRLRRRQKS
jgi:arylsulfatase A-like enzyme